ncbi:unnamed protein product [Vitrella brassicaformis CCMP3155]|uniref:Uncharacterized protein n=1 Tax=Vitrella brassicaformis (strain CCMP3155) TaxID=1169540 RepID=A0A0G4EX01_VITBC|nr:unnamed protein product [Vitrella brassicaformis CCMP3155]|eukprot:CEM02609.1 unnamed protein product [Vitrella brassicaformis CCMP3155]
MARSAALRRLFEEAFCTIECHREAAQLARTDNSCALPLCRVVDRPSPDDMGESDEAMVADPSAPHHLQCVDTMVVDGSHCRFSLYDYRRLDDNGIPIDTPPCRHLAYPMVVYGLFDDDSTALVYTEVSCPFPPRLTHTTIHQQHQRHQQHSSAPLPTHSHRVRIALREVRIVTQVSQGLATEASTTVRGSLDDEWPPEAHCLEDPKAIKAHTIHSLCVQHVCGIRHLLMRQTQGKCILDGLVKPSVPPPIVARHQTDKQTRRQSI